jgi:hypothetical protein
VKSAGFFLLRESPVPAVLIEGAFLSNPTEAQAMADPLVRQRMADAVGAGVVRYVEADGALPPGVPVPAGLPVPPRSSAPPPSLTRYWVTAGVFRRRADAERRRRALRQGEIGAIVRSRFAARFNRSMFFVVTGQHASLDEARSQRDALRAQGLPGMVNETG